MSKKFLELGVKKVFIIRVVPDENYVNDKKLWLKSGVDTLKKQYAVATDLKSCNIIFGMMSHGPCMKPVISINPKARAVIHHVGKF